MKIAVFIEQFAAFTDAHQIALLPRKETEKKGCRSSFSNIASVGSRTFRFDIILFHNLLRYASVVTCTRVQLDKRIAGNNSNLYTNTHTHTHIHVHIYLYYIIFHFIYLFIAISMQFGDCCDCVEDPIQRQLQRQLQQQMAICSEHDIDGRKDKLRIKGFQSFVRNHYETVLNFHVKIIE